MTAKLWTIYTLERRKTAEFVPLQKDPPHHSCSSKAVVVEELITAPKLCQKSGERKSKQCVPTTVNHAVYNWKTIAASSTSSPLTGFSTLPRRRPLVDDFAFAVIRFSVAAPCARSSTIANTFAAVGWALFVVDTHTRTIFLLLFSPGAHHHHHHHHNVL